MPPQQPNSPSRDIQALEAHRTQTEWAALREEFTSPEAIARLFDAPTGELARAAWERLKFDTELYEEQRQQVTDMIRILAGKIFDSYKAKLDERAKVTDETREELRDLGQQVFDYVEEIGERIKVRETPYSREAAEDVFSTHELLEMRSVMENLLRLDVDELVTMVQEDQVYIGMLIGQGEEESLLQPPEAEDSPALQEAYQNNLEVFMNFILGKPEPAPEETEKEPKPKSDFRIMSEKLLWQEIVRDMNYRQKQDLVLKFLQKSGDTEAECAEQTKWFIGRAIIAGVMTRSELSQMYHEKDKPDTPAHIQDLFKRLGDDFDEFLKASVAVKAQIEDQVAQAAAYIEEGPPIRNAVEYFFTFNKFGGETIARLGAVTAIVNGILCISDRITGKPDDESYVTAVMRGIGDAVTDKYVIGGVAAAAVGAEIVYPYMRSLAYSPSGEEEKLIAESREKRFLKEQAANHEELFGYFIDIYPELIERGKENAAKSDEGVVDITMEDVKDIAKRLNMPIEAGKFGFPNERLAAATIVRMFTACAKTFECETQAQMEKFLADERIYGHEG